MGLDPHLLVLILDIVQLGHPSIRRNGVLAINVSSELALGEFYLTPTVSKF